MPLELGNSGNMQDSGYGTPEVPNMEVPNTDGPTDGSNGTAVDAADYIGARIKPPSRKTSLLKDKTKVASDVIKLYGDDLQDRLDWAERRIQRTAKYRGWREVKSFPWNNASNSHLPIIMTDVQRTEDTLHNAVLSTRPVMNAKAMSKEWSEMESTVDHLLDYQVFVENKGESRIGNLISSFTQDGMYIAYAPYIKEKQQITRTYYLDYPGPKVSWDEWIMNKLTEYYPKAIILPGTRAPWNWVVKEENVLTGNIVTFKAEVYQEGEDKVQLVCHHNEAIFDGPALIPLELEDIVVPPRCENLQPRCMANPTGASHVFMVDYPSHDEVKKLIDSGFYDEVTTEEATSLEAGTIDSKQQGSQDPQAQKLLQDDLTGVTPDSHNNKTENTLTRLTFFGRADLDGDGFDEEVVYWMILSPQVILRARYLTEVYPITPMRRPFSMAKYIPVNGQFYAIGLIELMESGYDIIKQTFDQMMDNGSLTNTPFFFYRPMSGIRPEIMSMGPGEGCPTNNPKDDVFFPTLPQGMGAFGQNIITLVSQILDQTTLVGQLQLGGVPQGRSSALRTTSNMQALLQQGDARPERVLRRFFGGLAEVYEQFHELNKIFLPKQKMFRISHGATDVNNPYITIADRSQIDGRFMFQFSASILNTNKALAQAALQDMMGVLINPLMLQMQISTPETIYNLVTDYIKSKGQEPLRYSASPPGVVDDGLPKITVEDVILTIMNGYYPHGSPMEPLEQHVQKLQAFAQSPENLNMLSPMQAKILGQYAAVQIHMLQQQQQQQQLLANAQAFAQQNAPHGQPGPKGAGNPPSQGPAGNPQVQKNELYNETLPSAGGGGK